MKHKFSFLGAITLICFLIYVTIDATGEASLHFGANWECLRYLGCTTGFFGYDALEHFASGFALCLVIFWFFRKFPKLSLLHGTFWKDALIVVSMLGLIAAVWEIGECFHDTFRIQVLHETLRNVGLHINLLDQPSNYDTVGDMFFNCVGSLIALVPYYFAAKFDRKKLEQEQ